MQNFRSFRPLGAVLWHPPVRKSGLCSPPLRIDEVEGVAEEYISEQTVAAALISGYLHHL